MIRLGDKVRDIHTGFVGIAIARTEFLNGCIQYSVVAKVGKDNKLQDELGIDEGSLEVITPIKKKVVKKETGGPYNPVAVQRGY